MQNNNYAQPQQYQNVNYTYQSYNNGNGGVGGNVPTKVCSVCGSAIPVNSTMCPVCGVQCAYQPNPQSMYNNGYNNVTQNGYNNGAGINYNNPVPNTNYNTYNSQTGYNPNQGNSFNASLEYQRLSDYEKMSGILWMVIGIIQCLSLVGIICGVWNISAASSRLKYSKQLLTMPKGIYYQYENQMNSIITTLILNVFLGAVIGVVGSLFDMYVRSYVMQRPQVFGN